MQTKTDTASWNPGTPVAFPDSLSHAVADIKHEHNGVSFATAHDTALVGDLGDMRTVREERVTAYFISDNLEGAFWYRIAGGDYRMILARCKAESSSKLYVTKIDDHHINAVFRPHIFVEPDEPANVTWAQPSADENDVTVIRARILEHSEVSA